MRVVVVGAGLAGLAAADELRRGEVEVVVLEARDRVGGRVWSRRLENGAVVEMGAEFILPGCTVVRELAERHGLGLWQKGMYYGDREPRGGIGVERAVLAEAVATVDRELGRAGPDLRDSAQRFLERLELDPGAREAITARLEVSAAAAAEEVPARGLAGLAHIGADPSPSLAGGNQRLALALADDLGSAIRLGAPVRRIDWDRDAVRAASDDGEVEADACIVAVPASVIHRIRFEPSLPDAQAEALAAVRYAHAAKLFVPLRVAAASSAVLSVPERYWTWTATGEDDKPQPVVSAFAGSAPALERLGIAGGPEVWLESLARLRPDLELQPEGAVLSTWDDDPWIAAAYSISPDPQLTESLAGVVGRIAFAGEHVGGEFAGLMEGALRSGRRAARALIAAFADSSRS
jgi:monoamine oxidase